MSDKSLFDRPLIGYDGSKNCHYLITVFERLHSKFQNSTFTFVWDPYKNYIPPTARGPGIEKQIKQKTTGMQNIDVKIIEKDRSQPKTVNQYILDQFIKTKSTFIILGYYGSKGEKIRPIDLSSRVRQFAYDSKATVALIKNADRGTNNVIFCCDGSDVSLQGLRRALIFSKKFGYNLSVLHVYNEDRKNHSKQVKNDLKGIQQSTKQGKFQILIEKGDLIDYLWKKTENFDWVIVTKNGYRGQISKKTFIGSNTTEVLTKINLNIIIL